MRRGKMDQNLYDLKFGAGQRLIPLVSVRNTQQVLMSGHVLREAGCDAVMLTGDLTERVVTAYKELRRRQRGWIIGLCLLGATSTLYLPADIDALCARRRVAAKPDYFRGMRERDSRRDEGLASVVRFSYVSVQRGMLPEAQEQTVLHGSTLSDIVVVDSVIGGKPIGADLAERLSITAGLQAPLGLIGDITPQQIHEYTKVRCFLPETCLVDGDSGIPSRSKVKDLLASLRH